MKKTLQLFLFSFTLSKIKSFCNVSKRNRIRVIFVLQYKNFPEEINIYKSLNTLNKRWLYFNCFNIFLIKKTLKDIASWKCTCELRSVATVFLSSLLGYLRKEQNTSLDFTNNVIIWSFICRKLNETIKTKSI